MKNKINPKTSGYLAFISYSMRGDLSASSVSRHSVPRAFVPCVGILCRQKASYRRRKERHRHNPPFPRHRQGNHHDRPRQPPVEAKRTAYHLTYHLRRVNLHPLRHGAILTHLPLVHKAPHPARQTPRQHRRHKHTAH